VLGKRKGKQSDEVSKKKQKTADPEEPTMPKVSLRKTIAMAYLT
jgi:hypothetical protein